MVQSISCNLTLSGLAWLIVLILVSFSWALKYKREGIPPSWAEAFLFTLISWGIYDMINLQRVIMSGNPYCTGGGL